MRRGLKIPLFQSVLHSFTFKSYPRYFNRFINTSSPDNLTGLIDPNLNLPGAEPNPPITTPAESVAAEDFAFLRDSLLNTGADCAPSERKNDRGMYSHEAYLISSVIRNNRDGFGDETYRFLRQFRQKLNESLVIDVLNLIENRELALKFFLWSNRQIGYSHTVGVYEALLNNLNMLGSDKNERISDNLVRDIKNEDKEVLEKLMNVLIRKCCKNGTWNAALEELGRLKDLGYKPTKATYSALIQVFLEADKLDTVNLLHREMSMLSFRMNVYTLGCYAYSLCKSGMWTEALELIEKEEFVPDTVIYTKMISGLCDASLFEEAMGILNKMRSSSCIPNVVTYRILLCGCLNKRKLGRCKRILNMMITEGCFPSPRIFNSLVHAYCVSGDFGYAYKLLDKMVKCSCKPGYVVYNILIGGICGKEDLPNADMLELAEKVYREMINAGVTLNKINISNYTRCLCGAGKFVEAFDVIREMMSKGFIPDTSTYSSVIGFLCNASKVDKAFLLFLEMKENGIVPDVYTYTILIDSFCKAGLIKQARIWFDEMVNNGCAPNVVTYTALIHAYLKERKITRANELFEMMLSDGCVPNVITYTALIDGHCKGGEIEKACQIYARMRGSSEVTDVDMYFRVDGNSAVDPNVVTYGALVDGLCKVHRVKEARDLLDTMYIEDREPNCIIYDALIDGFCKVGKLDEAQEVFAKMSERGHSPNVFTYSSLIDRLFKDKRLDLALRVLSKMLENSCPPNVIIYTEMIDGLCKVGKTDEAYKLMVMMEEKGCKPNVVTYTAMIDGYGKAGKVKKCLETFRQMKAKDCAAPNYITYSVLIKHCCGAGLLDDAHQLLEEMKQTYWPKHMGSYRKVIEGFNRDFITSLGLLDETSENESIPFSLVYRLLIDSFRKAGRLDVALELHKEISSSLPYSNMYYSSLIESLCLSSKVDQALELYAEMVRKGGVAELSLMFNIVKGLIRVNRWEEALLISHSLCHMDIHWVPNADASEGS